jgi:ABC-type Fe3+ transport system substrate-binding protein
LFYGFLLSESGQQLIAKEGRVVAHPKVEPIYPRMKELQALLGTPRVQLRGEEKLLGAQVARFRIACRRGFPPPTEETLTR